MLLPIQPAMRAQAFKDMLLTSLEEKVAAMRAQALTELAMRAEGHTLL